MSEISKYIDEIRILSLNFPQRADVMMLVQKKMEIQNILNNKIAPYCYIEGSDKTRYKPLFSVSLQTLEGRSRLSLYTAKGDYDPTVEKNQSYRVRVYNNPMGMLIDEHFTESNFLKATNCVVVDDPNYRDLLILIQGVIECT